MSSNRPINANTPTENSGGSEGQTSIENSGGNKEQTSAENSGDSAGHTVTEGSEGEVSFVPPDRKSIRFQRYCRWYWLAPMALSLLIAVFLVTVLVLNHSSSSKSQAEENHPDVNLELISTQSPANVSTRPAFNISICKTPLCEVLGQAYVKSINNDVDPCEDFYGFTCGGLQKDYDLKKIFMDHRALKDLFLLHAAMKEIGYNYLHDIYNASLDSTRKRKLTASDKQISTLYGSCLARNSDTQVAEAIRKVKALFVDCRLNWFADAGRRRNFIRSRQRSDLDSPLLYSLGRLSLHWGLSVPWLSFHSAHPTGRNIAKNMLEVKQMVNPTKVIIEDRKSRINLHDIPRNYWVRNVKDALQKIRSCLLNGKNEHFLKTFQQGPEYKLMLTKTTIMLESWGETVSPRRLSNLILHQMLGERCLSNFSSTIVLAVAGKIEDFERVTGVSLAALVNRQLAGVIVISNKDEVIMNDVIGIAVALDLVQRPSGNEQIIEDYIVMWLVKKLAPFVGGAVTKAACLVDKYKECYIDNVSYCERKAYEYLPLSGAALIGRHVISAFGIAELLAIANLIKTAIAEILVNLGWMDEATKQIALKKINNTLAYVGYPGFFNESNYQETAAQIGGNFLGNILNIKSAKVASRLIYFSSSSNREQTTWQKAQSDINAAYESELDGVLLPGGLGLYNYVEGAPVWINLASSPVGHEIFRIFDDSGSEFDKKGGKSKWWSEQTRQNFEKSTTCLMNQYSVDVPLHTNETSNGTVLLNENFADNGGLRALFHAFQLYLYTSGGYVEILPHMEQYTPEQLLISA
ncbi:uncharacterized protein LOC111243779 isoform X2 [Varroa destructor]|uniref:Uncharacterized protein n=1 Tax=Varroa destructor TaxID=109461 RepID=A0A7M7J7N3_VARDE|nr:uncharacterized protein LOC111243779 isoform X2 [Varroa destructor]